MNCSSVMYAASSKGTSKGMLSAAKCGVFIVQSIFIEVSKQCRKLLWILLCSSGTVGYAEPRLCKALE